MAGYLAAIWRTRYFWISLVRMDLRTRYRRSLLGMGWSLLHPIAMTAILCLVFHSLFHQPIRHYAPFLMAGLATWNYILTATLHGCQCFFQGESYIRQYPAPLAVYPLRTALGGTVHFLIALVVVIALAWYFQGLSNPLCLLGVVPALGLLFVFTWSLAVLAGVLNVYFQDTQHLSEVGFQILFYATPIMYRPELLRANHLGWIVDCNPLVALLELVREPILQGRLPDAATFGIACKLVLLLALVAGLILGRAQRRLIFHL